MAMDLPYLFVYGFYGLKRGFFDRIGINVRMRTVRGGSGSYGGIGGYNRGQAGQGQDAEFSNLGTDVYVPTAQQPIGRAQETASDPREEHFIDVEELPDTQQKLPVCPICLTPVLQENTKISVPCGHIICIKCCDTLEASGGTDRKICAVCRGAVEKYIKVYT